MKQERKQHSLIEGKRQESDMNAFIQHLLDNDYSKRSVSHYKSVIKCISGFMDEIGQKEYTRDVGINFLAEMVKSKPLQIAKRMEVVVRRFNCFLEQAEYAYAFPHVNRESPPQFAEAYEGYYDYLKNRGLRESTIIKNHYSVLNVLIQFNSVGIQGFSELKPETIYDAFGKTSDKRNFSTPLRSFLRYLYDTGVIENDYSAIVPAVRRAQPVPSIYTREETERLLNTVEPNAMTAKRNNAIILLALKLGMRSSDIASLKIADVDFSNKIINFIQEKNQIPQRLELLPEIEDALFTYIFTVRPPSNLPNIFISLTAPFRKIDRNNIYWVINKRFKRAGIDTGDRKRGGHSLRSTLASELINENVPYDVVRKVLGHEDPTSAKHYVNYDLESLRSCSIEAPPITGKLAAYMETLLGGATQ